jgi:hypothetical protein
MGAVVGGSNYAQGQLVNQVREHEIELFAVHESIDLGSLSHRQLVVYDQSDDFLTRCGMDVGPEVDEYLTAICNNTSRMSQ